MVFQNRWLVWVTLIGVSIGLLAEVAQAAPQRSLGRPGGDRNAEKSDNAEKKKDDIKPYDEVVTEDAVTHRGLFVAHQIEDKLFYEIPVDQLNKDMLWVVQIGKTQAGFSYAGMPVRDRVVRWEMRGKHVLLRDVKYSIRASDSEQTSIKSAVESTNLAPIIKSFPVKAWGTDKKPVIDVTSLFTTDVSEFSAARSLNAQSMDAGRSFFEEIKTFPENVDVKVLATYKISTGNSSSAQSSPRRRPQRSETRRDPSQSAVTVVLHHSMKKLPDRPMASREYDERVGFFTVGFQDYAEDENHEVESVRYITRWRLEKKDPKADVSEPVEPIVFYVGRGVPEKWKPFVKQGIEMWQPAFEAAGFKNAIIGKLAPSEKEDPSWDAEDARISTIRWLPSTIENAFGPHIHDPRTGEILEADVRIYHNVLKLCRDWYFVQASACDERAQKLPMPDDLVGELLAYVVAHEVGHSIGFPHNMKASSAFTIENLRDADFTAKWGTEASIMDYGRFNYVAQPGDNAALIPKIGPYDFFSVEWGYRQFESTDAEEKGLKQLVDKQKDNPLYRFGNADPSEDPTRQTEDLGSDSLLATELGLKNIDRIAEYLVSACCQEGEDYSLLENMYEQLLRQRTRELSHVTGIVGGFEKINLFYGDADQRFHPIDAERQQSAVKFLIDHTFLTNEKLVNPEITMRLEADGAADRILQSQRSILRSLINTDRVERMAEHIHRSDAGSQDDQFYEPIELLEDLRQGIWSELESKSPEIDLYRRNLQRAHIDLLAERVKDKSDKSDLPALARAQLKLIRDVARSRTQPDIVGYTSTANGEKAILVSTITQAHLAQVIADIEAALDPQVHSTTAASAVGGGASPRR